MKFTRRETLILGGGLILVPSCTDTLDPGIEKGDDYDEILAKLHTTDAEFGGGLSNHGPMAMDALVALGHEDRIADWAAGYSGALILRDDAEPLADSEREAALGVGVLRNAWIETYLAEVDDLDPAELVSREFSLLAKGYAAAAYHGVLRVGHAARALQRKDTPARRRELAHGLGYWAARWLELPGTPASQPEAGLDVAAALSRITLVPAPQRITGGLISERLTTLDAPTFAAEVAALDLDAEPIDNALNSLVAVAARAMTNRGTSDIAYLHTITGTSVLRHLWPWLSDADKRLAVGYAFQSVAAIHATHANEQIVPATVPSPNGDVASVLAAGAVATGEHTIKLAEACAREYQTDPRPEFLSAFETWTGP